MAILRAAMQAPSAANQQPWKFFVVTNRAKLAALSEVSPYVGMTKNAPIAIFPYGYPAEEKPQEDRFDESRIHFVE